MNRFLLLALLLLPVTSAPAANPVTPPPRVKLSFDRFHDYAETVAALRAMQKEWPGWLELRSIGKSWQGRDLWLAVLGDPDGPPETERPAMYIDANVHGNEIQGTDVCLYTVWYLLENKDRLPRVRDLLRRVTLYVLPCVNPDAREAWFHEPATPHTPRSGLKPRDDDRDGRADEDGPDDLDGDGSITQMRKYVGHGGTHRLDPDDPRLLVPVAPGEDGDWVLLGWEGVDDDGDGRVNEDGPGGYDMNRSDPADWQPDWIQYGAGPYPLCWPETRAIADFVLAHPNIAALQSYHNAGGMILRGPGTKERGEYPREDVAVYDELGKTGEKMLPHYRYMTLWKDLYPVHGGFVTWAFEGLGIFSFTNELWSDEQYGALMDGEGDRHTARWRGRLAWNDRMELGREFTDWTPYHHPQYGDIEVGGFVKTSSRVPPVFMLEELCHRNAMFTLYHADEMPLLRMKPPEVEPIADGLWRVRVEVENERLIPTIAGYARRNRIGRPDVFLIDAPEGRVVAGGRVVGPYAEERILPQEHRPAALRIEDGVGSHGRVRVEWITTSPKVVVRYVSDKGGTVEVEHEE